MKEILTYVFSRAMSPSSKAVRMKTTSVSLQSDSVTGPLALLCIWRTQLISSCLHILEQLPSLHTYKKVMRIKTRKAFIASENKLFIRSIEVTLASLLMLAFPFFFLATPTVFKHIISNKWLITSDRCIVFIIFLSLPLIVSQIVRHFL